MYHYFNEDRLDTMLLVLAATEFEMKDYKLSAPEDNERVLTEVCGVGPVEAAVRTMRILADHKEKIKYVINFGIGGAYLAATGTARINPLDICLAEQEVLGDYGVCYENRVESFTDPGVMSIQEFTMNEELLTCVRQELVDQKIDAFSGPFVTVNGASGSAERGRFLQKKYHAICENMEGAAIARCCEMFMLPMIELRAVSNMVEDRPGQPWKIAEASSRSGYVASCVVERLKGLI